MMKCFLLTFLLAFLAFATISAQRNRDSLLQEIAQAKEDSNKIKAIQAVGSSYRENNPDSAVYYEQQVLFLSRKIGFSKGESKALDNLGYIAMQKGDYPTALDLNFKALKLSKTLHFDSITASTYQRMGLAYYYMSDYEKAIYYYTKANEVLQKLTYNDVLGTNMGNLARGLT